MAAMTVPSVVDTFRRGLRLPEVSWRGVAIAAGVAALIAGLAGGVWLWSSVQAQRADTAYAAAFARLGSAGTGGAASTRPEERAAAIRGLEAVLAEHPTAAAAPLAAYELGNLRYAAREYGPARGAYEVAVARAGSPTVRALASAGIGYTWEAERDHARAAAAFQTGLDQVKPGEFYYGELLLDLARVQAAGGRKDDAIAAYRRFLKEVPRSSRGEEVRAQLARLGAAP
jgi:tetratricopeptide (TPR) repeat protein